MKTPGFTQLSALALAIARPGLALDATYLDSSAQHPPSFISATDAAKTLDSENGTAAVLIIDYGRSVEGIPAFEVLSAHGDTSVFEVSYAESRAAFEQYMSDGPLPLAAAMDTYRVNRYNISAPGLFHNKLVQGAFRYQKFNLSSPGSLHLRHIGVHATTDTTAIKDLPGSFESSDEGLNRIWQTGARTVQLTEIPEHSVPDFYTVTPEGMVAESQAPQVYGAVAGSSLLIYDMTFEVKPEVGGFGFIVLSDTLNDGIYLSCDVDNRSISAHSGSTTFNPVIASAKLPANLTLTPDSWTTVIAKVSADDISISMGGAEVMAFSQDSKVVGSFGLGASYGHRAIFRNLKVTSRGQIVYSHSLTNSSFLPDFFSGTNPHSNVVDGSRRDRIAYTGDLDVAGGAALVSTHGLEYIFGSLDLLGSYQTTTGFFIPTAKIQQEPLEGTLDVDQTGLIGYSFNFLTAVASTYMHTGDIEFAERWASPIQSMLDWAHSQTLNNGLFNVSQIAFGGDWNYYDPPQAGVVTKFNVLYAYALQECHQLLADAGVNPMPYATRLNNLRTAIDSNLWNDDLNAYYLSDDLSRGFAQDANAIAILAGVNLNASHSTEIILSSLATLLTPAGPKAFSPEIIDAGFEPYISPYASSYHLRAALASNASHSALDLLNNLWEPMANKENANYTGTFWETLDADGHPGLGLSTSLCHGWAAGPTAELSKYVLGASPTAPGWATFQVAPRTLGLRFAKGKLPTTSGNVSVEWRFDDNDLLTMAVEAPSHFNGTVYLPQPMLIAANESTFMVNGSEREGPFALENGRLFIQQEIRNLKG